MEDNCEKSFRRIFVDSFYNYYGWRNIYFFRYIDPLINKREVVYRLENVTMVVYDEDTSETVTYYIEDEPVYIEI